MSIVNFSTKDFTELQKKDYPVLEPGEYQFTVANKLTFTKSKSSSNMLVEVQLQNDDALGQKVLVFDNLVQLQTAEWKWYQFFRALGFTDADIAAGIDTDVIQGMSLRARVGQEPSQKDAAKMWNVVKEYLYEQTAANG